MIREHFRSSARKHGLLQKESAIVHYFDENRQILEIIPSLCTRTRASSRRNSNASEFKHFSGPVKHVIRFRTGNSDRVSVPVVINFRFM